MPAPLSFDLRRRVVQAYQNGEGTYEELATRFGIGRATVDRVLRRERETGSAAAKPTGGSKPKLDEDDMESIHFILLEQPDITLAALAERFVHDGGAEGVTRMTLWRALDRLGLTRKKKRSYTTDARMRTS